jgi:hypothetical protein
LAFTVLCRLAAAESAKLDNAAVIYRIPPRLSSFTVIDLLERWLAGDTGGRRHESASIALLRFAGPRFRNGWDSVESHLVNDPAPYDALCRQGDAVRAVGEVKAQPVTVDHLKQLSREMGSHQSPHGYFFTKREFMPQSGTAEIQSMEKYLKDQDALGRRIDIIDVTQAIRHWLPLLDQADQDLPAFMKTLGQELDAHGQGADRRALAQRLEEL